MGKDMKIKHSASSPPYKLWGNFFRKWALHGSTELFWTNFMGDVLHGEWSDHGRDER